MSDVEDSSVSFSNTASMETSIADESVIVPTGRRKKLIVLDSSDEEDEHGSEPETPSSPEGIHNESPSETFESSTSDVGDSPVRLDVVKNIDVLSVESTKIKDNYQDHRAKSTVFEESDSESKDENSATSDDKTPSCLEEIPNSSSEEILESSEYSARDSKSVSPSTAKSTEVLAAESTKIKDDYQDHRAKSTVIEESDSESKDENSATSDDKTPSCLEEIPNASSEEILESSVYNARDSKSVNFNRAKSTEVSVAETSTRGEQFTTPRVKPKVIIESDTSEDEDITDAYQTPNSEYIRNASTLRIGATPSTLPAKPSTSTFNEKSNYDKRPSRLSEDFRNITSILSSTMMEDKLSVVEESEDDIINVSDTEPEIATRVNPSTANLFKKPFESDKKQPAELKKTNDLLEVVSKAVYDEQERTVRKLEAELAQVANVVRTVNLTKLPDKGKLLQARLGSIQKSVQIAKDKLEGMVVNADKAPSVPERKPILWEDIEVQSDIVQPKTMGQRALQTHNVQKSLTMERLQILHGSISNRPSEDTFADEPQGLKVNLMPHQKHALAWLMWREQQQPPGGILSDDMGLGKTLTIISLMLKSLQESPNEKENEWKGREKESIPGGTLIVCPASLVKQWEGEINKHCRSRLVNAYCYHGPNRESKSRTLAKYDMVITTYAICQNEMEKSTPLFKINWRRVVLDEGHQIRNHKSRTSMAVCNLEAKSRWILTGTPIHNKEVDMYALMKFLRCTPFDDFHVWKTWIANKNTGGYQRLQTVIASLMLRRTKEQLQTVGALKLPERTWKILNVVLSEDEEAIYEKLLMFSRSIFAQYLEQRSNKGEMESLDGKPRVTKAVDPNSPYFKIYEKVTSRHKQVKQHEILMVLLRLRQCCCHPSLITQMLEKMDLDDEDDVGVMNLMEELGKLDLEDHERGENNNVQVAETKKFNIQNPLFSREYRSQKVETILNAVRDITEIKKEKVIIVSQWTSFLRLIGDNLAKEKIEFVQLDGTLKIETRMKIVQNINNSSHSTKVLLLSLTAGGVGLNLVGANHLLLVDLHWNPQLELQAQDRIYRVGQMRPVNIYKCVTTNTIEERVKQIQEYKLSLADSMLTGAKVDHTKLTFQDMRMLFNM